MHCLLCRAVFSELDELEDIDNKTPFSKKPICAIIIYLAERSTPPIDVSFLDHPYEQQICKPCLGDILAYDEYMVKLLEVQKRIVFSLRSLKENDEYVDIQTLDECVDDIDEQVEKVEICLDQFNASDTNDDRTNALLHETTIKVEIDENSSTGKTEHQNYSSSPSQEPKEIDQNVLEKNLKYVLDYSNSSIDGTDESCKGKLDYRVPAKCNSCGKVFKNKSTLSRHIKGIHNKPTKMCKCDICGVITKDEEYLELHMNIHDGKSDLECRYCNKRYTRRINVIRHMQKHWDKKKFQCERCGLRFSERPMYYNHRLQHDAEEDPLICAVCNQSFKTRRTYRHHLWTHREDRPRFGCDTCGKTFVERYTLKVHLRSHSTKEAAHNDGRRKNLKLQQQEKEPYSCIICGNQFLTNDSVDHHMKVEHDVILKTEKIFV